MVDYTFKNRVFSYFIIVLIIICGIFAFTKLGMLEDPDFSVKSAVITTAYPGASPEEVELEVTDRLEKAIQEMPQVRHLWSMSRAGFSSIRVDVHQQYWADELPQVWDEMRKKVRDTRSKFPPGVEKPVIGDDFNFVYGFVLALTGDGYTYKELEKTAEALRKELSLVEGVARVTLWGVQDKVIYLDITEQQLAESGLTPQNFKTTLQRQNMVVDSGAVDVQNRRMRISPSGEFKSPEEIGELYLHQFTGGTTAQKLAEQLFGPQALPSTQEFRPTIARGTQPSGELIRIKDIAKVTEGYREPPRALMRHNGQPAIAIALANLAGGNVVVTGKKIEKRLAELVPSLPAGIEVSKIAWQSDLVTSSINAFMVNLVEAVLIVLVVIAIAMGWRMGIIIGTGLILTILAVFVLMFATNIPLHRVSLGALIIALGMMVDNAIVISDGIAVRFQQGMDRAKAAVAAAKGPAIPLLGATIVACMAFYPIYGSKSDTGEYAGALFTVVAFSLVVSWILSITITPIQCFDMLPASKQNKDVLAKDPYDTKFFRSYRILLEWVIKRRRLFLVSMGALLVVSIIGFGYVDRMFFPDSSRAQVMVDFWYPEGTRIQEVSEQIKPTEQYLKEDDRVASVSSFIGGGPPRFYLPLDPEMPYPNYAQLVVNTHSADDVNALIEDVTARMEEHYSDPMVRVRKFSVGPSNTWKFEWHISGPAEANLALLRELGDKGAAILANSPYAHEIKTSMMNKVSKVVPEYDQAKGRWVGVHRDDIAEATRRAQDGEAVGLYRERDDLYPIILRHTAEERKHSINMEMLQVKPELFNYSIPLAQVTKGIDTEWEDPMIIRWNRRRANTVQGVPYRTSYPDLKDRVIKQFQELEKEFPPHYEIYMKGEDQSTRDSQENLRPGMAPAIIIMITILVALFNSVRTPLIIIVTIPFAIIGITWGLLAYGSPFGFMALLGGMSLAGMMIKNAVVLLDQINLELSEGKSPYDAVVSSSVSRLRPVILGALTTVLGVIPLLTDVFWESMAVTIMAGLSFGTILTMLVVPVLYCVFYKVRSPE